MDIQADVLIVGGGLVGMPLALALAQQDLSVVLVDAVPPPAALAESFDGRASALALASARLFQSLGIWDAVKLYAQPINDILVTDGRAANPFKRGGPAPFLLHFDPEEEAPASDPEPLGYLVENRHSRQALLKALLNTDNLCLIAPATVVKVVASHQSIQAKLSDGRNIAASVCLAADGKASPLRVQAGIGTVGWSYGQSGLVTTVEHDWDHEGIAQEYFLPAGPFAILPLTGKRSSLVWTERSAAAKTLHDLPDDLYAEQMTERFGAYLGDVRPIGPRWCYPLSLQLAHDYVTDRLALVGDAAHTIHPIAGQGLNLGLRDVAALAEVLIDARDLGLDIGSATVLERYQRWRRFDNVSFAVVTDALNRLFGNDIAPVRLARDIGMQIVAGIGPARRFLMQNARGSATKMPKLMRGQIDVC